MDKLFKHVLMIGPGGNKGGIASVINTFRECYPEVKYISSYPDNKSYSRIIHFIKCIWNVNKTLRWEKQITIVHLHVASNGSFIRKSILLMLAKMHGKSTVFHMHGGAFREFYGNIPLKQMIINKLMRFSDAVIALSEEWEVYFREKMQLNNVWIIGNPVAISPYGTTMKINVPIELLFLGKICDEKGIFELINILCKNEEYRQGKIRLTIAGIGETERLIDAIHTLDIRNSIRFVGWIEGEEKKKVIHNTDIFILPSHFEGLPVSIIECMMCRKPIIATNVGGIPTLVENGYNGWLLESGNLKEIHTILNEVISKPDIINTYGENSYKRALDFSPEKIRVKILEVYQSIATSF